jgi:hypothetical protein
MIDFRYLLTTIVAIFLALAIGLLIGSGLLADPLAQDLDRQVQEKIEQNNELRSENGDLKTRIDAEDDFGWEIAARSLEGDLAQTEIVLFRLEGTDGALIDRVRDAIELAGGSVPTIITLTNGMAMDDETLVEDLRADLEGLNVEGEDLAVSLAAELGSRAAADSNGAGDDLFPVVQAIAQEHGLIDVAADDEDDVIPTGSDFVVAGGAAGEPPHDVVPLSESLLTGLAEFTSEVVAVEGWESGWSFVPRLRDSEVREIAATVDHGDTAPGAISMVAELSRFVGNDPGHYGFRDGADGVVPDEPGG